MKIPKRTAYTADQLTFVSYEESQAYLYEQESKRQNQIFAALKALAIKKEPMTQLEKRALNWLLIFSANSGDVPSDFDCLDDYVFTNLIEAYANDFFGVIRYYSVYYKSKRLLTISESFLKNNPYSNSDPILYKPVQLSISDVQADLIYLYKSCM